MSRDVTTKIKITLAFSLEILDVIVMQPNVEHYNYSKLFYS